MLLYLKVTLSNYPSDLFLKTMNLKDIGKNKDFPYLLGSESLITVKVLLQRSSDVHRMSKLSRLYTHVLLSQGSTSLSALNRFKPDNPRR